MGVEDQGTVSAWMQDTFPGADPASPRKALRALEEIVELCVACGASRAEIVSAATKALAGAFKFDTDTLEGWQARAPEPSKVPAEAADVLIVLYGVAWLRGFDLHAEVDKKMAINRSRKWKPRGDGTGYHIPEG